MKIHQTIGLVAGVHALAFLLIFVSPGCSSTSNTATAATAPGTTPLVAAAPTPAPGPVQDAPAPLVAVPNSGPVFYSPTRPNTAAAEALAPAVPPPDVTPAETYTVRSGDSLWLIAHRHHIKVSALAAANNLRSGASLRSGQKLIIPQPAGVAADSGASADHGEVSARIPAGGSAARAGGAAGGQTTYTVKAGDKLSSIARRYGLTTGALAAENNISDPRKIRPGQVLVIPAGGAAHRTHKARSATGEATPAAAPDASAPATLQPIAPAPSAAPSSSAPVPIIRIDGGDASGASAPSSNG